MARNLPPPVESDPGSTPYPTSLLVDGNPTDKLTGLGLRKAMLD